MDEQEVYRRAGGRRRFNAEEKHRVLRRRLLVAELVQALGLGRGVQSKIAQALGVSRSTISKDIQALERDQGALRLQRGIARMDRLAQAEERAELAWDEERDEAACVPRPEAEACPQVDPPRWLPRPEQLTSQRARRFRTSGRK